MCYGVDCCFITYNYDGLLYRLKGHQIYVRTFVVVLGATLRSFVALLTALGIRALTGTTASVFVLFSLSESGFIGFKDLQD
jgi:hypothetical protein